MPNITSKIASSLKCLSAVYDFAIDGGSIDEYTFTRLVFPDKAKPIFMAINVITVPDSATSNATLSFGYTGAPQEFMVEAVTTFDPVNLTVFKSFNSLAPIEVGTGIHPVMDISGEALTQGNLSIFFYYIESEV